MAKRDEFVGLSNISKAASVMGRLGRGIPKRLSDGELERRKRQIEQVNERRRKKAEKLKQFRVTGIWLD